MAVGESNSIVPVRFRVTDSHKEIYVCRTKGGLFGLARSKVTGEISYMVLDVESPEESDVKKIEYYGRELDIKGGDFIRAYLKRRSYDSYKYDQSDIFEGRFPLGVDHEISAYTFPFQEKEITTCIEKLDAQGSLMEAFPPGLERDVVKDLL